MYSCWARRRVWDATAKSRSLPTRSESAIAALGMTQGARGHRAGGSERPATTTAKSRSLAAPDCARQARDDTAHWRPSAKVNEHNEERSLERLVDMEVSRKKD